ncbi:MAG: GNAT family N-acetyltransferase [Nocardioidaceae bacterium]|nr:GNAT family N-acetyltransferase [Nocardioidaceae bacterium]
MTVTRALAETDTGEYTALLVRNREHLRPTDPERPDSYWTEEGQAALVARLLRERAAGTTYAFVILDPDGALAGRITLNEVVRGPLQSASVGYWVSADREGRGLVSAALAETVRFAFDELGLHRLQAGTLLHNERSQRVLLRAGFTQYGMAPKYLRIAGRWQDHLLFQLLAHDEE